MIIDCHTHHLTAVDAVVSCSPEVFSPRDGILYSVGFHPWNVFGGCDWDMLEVAARHPQVIAIGETGLDRLRGGDIECQERAFVKHVTLSEMLKKPLIIHEVKAVDSILRLRRELRPIQKWVRHGFRGNANVAKMLTDKGCYLSFGDKFNAEAVKGVPGSRLLIESDDSGKSIYEIAEKIATARGVSKEYLLAVVMENSRIVFG